VFINLEDVFKYGFRTAQAYAIKNNVIKKILIITLSLILSLIAFEMKFPIV